MLQDPKTRFQTLVADASNKTNVVEQFRSSLSGSVDDLVFSNNNRYKLSQAQQYFYNDKCSGNKVMAI